MGDGMAPAPRPNARTAVVPAGLPCVHCVAAAMHSAKMAQARFLTLIANYFTRLLSSPVSFAYSINNTSTPAGFRSSGAITTM